MVHHVAGRDAAGRVVIEEALTGKEASLLIFADGRDYVLMPAARDHKRIGENDTGPNTGGMGTITDASVLERGFRIESYVRSWSPLWQVLVKRVLLSRASCFWD